MVNFWPKGCNFECLDCLRNIGRASVLQVTVSGSLLMFHQTSKIYTKRLAKVTFWSEACKLEFLLLKFNIKRR